MTMDFLPDEVQDPTILRRIIFAAVYLPTELPQYWSVVTEFASQARRHFWYTRYHVPQLQSCGIAECLRSFPSAFECPNICRPMIANLLYDYGFST